MSQIPVLRSDRIEELKFLIAPPEETQPREAGLLNTRQRPQLTLYTGIGCQQLGIPGGSIGRIRRLRTAVMTDLENEHVLRTKAGVDLRQPEHGRYEQPGSDDEDER